MRIVYLEPAGKGGMIHYAFQLCRALTQQGADVTLITTRNYELAALPHPFHVEPIIDLWDPKPSGRMSTSWIAVAGRKVRRLTRAARYYAQWLSQIRRVAELNPDVVIIGDIRFPFDLFPLMLLRRKTRLLVDICHNVHPFATGGSGAGLFTRSSRKRLFYKRIYRLFDRVFVHFERNRAEFLDSFGVPSERVSVIVHGNEEIFRELRRPGVDAGVLRRRLGLSESEPVVLLFGTLSRYKGADVLIESFAPVHRESGARLVIAGFPFSDFDLSAHEELARKAGISNAVVWVPEYIDSGEVAAWMELASVVVFPYRDIYQSGALHIAQTFGVPIVASAIGAMQDVITDGETGLLVPSGDVPALSDALIRLLRDWTLASRLGTNAARDAQGRFAWSVIAETILRALGESRGVGTKSASARR